MLEETLLLKSVRKACSAGAPGCKTSLESQKSKFISLWPNWETWPNETGLDQNQNNWIQRLSGLLWRIWGTSYPWACTSRKVWLNAMGSSGVLCLKAGDALFAAHRVELPVLIDTKEIFISLYLHAEEKCLVLMFFVDKPGTEERTRDGFSYLGFLLRWAPAGRLIAHCHHWLITCQAGGAGWSFLFTNMTELSITCVVLCVSHLWKARIGSLCCRYITEKNTAYHCCIYNMVTLLLKDLSLWRGGH